MDKFLNSIPRKIPPMQLVKQQLLAALASELEILSPGAGARAALESPKVAEHGDFACTAAMQLSKALKQNPRAVAEKLREQLLKNEQFAHWVAAVEIAGPGFINFRLKPEAKQQVIREVLAHGNCYGYQKETGQKMMVEFVSANPTGPLHVGHGRQAALGDSICNLWATQGQQVYREFYYNDAGVQIATLAKSLSRAMPAGRPTRTTPRARPFTTANISTTLPRTFWPKRRCRPMTAALLPAVMWMTWTVFASLQSLTYAMSKTWI
jgi:arginyl-tRNA synthetase